MNKIYSLKYCHITNTIKVVSELTRRVCKGSTRRGRKLSVLSSLALTALLPSVGMASVVSGNIPYQTYRDFAENKGVFQAGSTDIIIKDKNGNVLGALNSVPMPDFSATDTSGIATLISPQFLSGVRHNGGYTGVRFGDGDNLYNLVSRNDDSVMDIHTPRLDKLVTEVAPVDAATTDESFNNSNNYAAFYRFGSGTQLIKDSDGKNISLSGAYVYLTGGTVTGLHYLDWFGGTLMASTADLLPEQGPLPTHIQGGDSGSPLYAYDKSKGKWVLIGNLSSGSGKNDLWSVVRASSIQNIINSYSDGLVNYNSTSPENIIWSFDAKEGVGSLSQGSYTHIMHGQKGTDLNAGKDLSFRGHNGVIDIQNDVIQGAGSLTFADDYTVATSNGSTWTGAGIIVDKDASVNWQVNGVKGDNLHKIGEGTLVVQGTGVNEGGLKVGDGTVVLNQQADSSGHVQAFSSVNIASGRPTVVLADNRQVNPDNISWGYRGGVLDVNGNDLTFHQIKAADYGAVLTNNADKRALITLNYALQPDSVKLNDWSYSFSGVAGSLYKYKNPYTGTMDYFILKQNSYSYFPINQTSNTQWEFVGHSQSDAQKLVADRFNSAGYLFHGQLKGNLDVENRLSDDTPGALVMDGSANMSGTFTQENGRL
ncbi:peptidase, partial [Escherichia coli]|nr:peptidase [Escherichia coli]